MTNPKRPLFTLLISFISIISTIPVYSQIFETFSDGDFTNSPTWSGDDSCFKISIYSSSAWSIQPRLQLNGTVSGIKHLRFSAPISNIDSTEWRFWVRIGLSGGTSTTNNARIYLTSDSANLLGPLNGYYVMFGDDGSSTSDNITLWKQTGMGTSKIINGTVGNISSSKNTSIKVLRDNSGMWKLYSDTTGGANYLLEGTATDVTHTTSEYTGVCCKFTSSNNTSFYFDDIYVGPIVKDITPPTVVSLTMISETQLELQFSESLLPSTATNLNFYSLNNGIGNPIAATMVGANNSAVQLTFGTPFSQNIAYLLLVSGVTDMEENIILPQNLPFTYYVAQPWDVVINEIMADPDPEVGLPNAEYIELKNNTSLPINLNGWLLKVGTSTKTLPNYTLLPDSFVIVTSSGSAPNFDTTIPIISVSSLSISNSGQEIILYTPTNLLMHYVNFSDSWYKDNFKKNGGWSLEQIDPLNFCGESSNWIASSSLLGGTPGRRNSQLSTNRDLISPYLVKAVAQNNRSVMLYFSESMKESLIANTNRYVASQNLGVPISAEATSPMFKSVLLTFADTLEVGRVYILSITDTITDCSGNILPINNSVPFAIAFPPSFGDVVINEILSNPREGSVDFVELYNRSEKIIDLKQLLLGNIEYGSPVYKTITPEGYLLFPKEYAVLSSNTEAVKREYPTITVTNFIQLSSMPTYNNDEGIVLLGDLNSIEIDRVNYDANMHYGMLKSTDGVSLERVSPLRPSTDRSNWHSAASTVNYATPGYKNSQWADIFAEDNSIVIYPEVFTPNLDGIDDIATITYRFNELGYRISIWVYNAAGFKVKQLVNNDISSVEGSYSWDGTMEDNSTATSGIYLFVIEVWKLDGTVKKYKKPVTISARF